MNDLNRRLLRAFQFHSSDLRANRSGRISQRQEAVLRAGSLGMRLSMAVFAIVMLGSVGIVIFTSSQMAGEGGITAPSINVGSPIVLGAVAAVVIAIGYLVSRSFMRAARSRQIHVARGQARIVAADSDDMRVAIGATTLRLLTEEHVAAFQPGTEYRVFYLDAPVPIILSAEVAGDEASGGEDDPSAADAQLVQSNQLRTFRRAYLLVIIIGVLALGIPIVGFASANLPEGLRGILWIALLVVAIGFVLLALRWLSGGQQQEHRD